MVPSWPRGSAALFVAHPGHELRLYGWMAAARPVVFVMTDGSGGEGISRLDSSDRLLRETGCTAGAIYGRFSDREIYRQILDGDILPAATMAVQLADFLVAHGIETLVADAWQLYNPAHDLCRVIANFAVLLAARSGWGVQTFDYAVVEPAPHAAATATMLLDHAVLHRKIAAALAYEELRDEVTAALARGGEGLRVERLFRVDPHEPLGTGGDKPFYEIEGERRVATGRYGHVLRYATHVAPFLARLARALHVAAPSTFRPALLSAS